MKRPGTHRYVSYPYGDLGGWVIRVKVGEYGSGLWVGVSFTWRPVAEEGYGIRMRVGD